MPQNLRRDPNSPMYDFLRELLAYEEGRLNEMATVNLFSYLVRTGQAWTLQGHYGRTAHAMITLGVLNADGSINSDALENIGDMTEH